MVVESWRPRPVDPPDLDDRVLAVLMRFDGPATMRQVEAALNDPALDTFQVRGAVWRLVHRQLAMFTAVMCIVAVRR
jgi:hypothetical protein